MTIDVADPFPLVDGMAISGATNTAILVSDSNPRLRNLLITENHGVGSANGCGMRIATSLGAATPTITNVMFTNNTGNEGAAVFITSSAAPRFEQCDFTANSAAVVGGAVSIDSGETIEFDRCSFLGNQASDQGGGRVALYCATILAL